MKLPRRQFSASSSGRCCAPSRYRDIARAQDYPTRVVRIIVAVAPWWPHRPLAARLIGQWLSERLGQPFVIENRPGAGNNIGTEAVARAPADGYTLLVTAAAAAINATLFDKLGYNFLRDFAPIASINHIPLILVAHPSFPPTTVFELIAYAKANPGKVNLATPGLANRTRSRRRASQDDDRRQHGRRALSRLAGGADRSHRRAGAIGVRRGAYVDRTRKERPATRARGGDV